MNSKWVTRDEARALIRKYCAYQERSHSEVHQRLKKMQIPYDWIDEFTIELIEENYLNESRFAELFARSKMNQKKWGKFKIKQVLKIKGVSPYCIKEAMSSLDDEIYEENLRSWIQKKMRDYRKSKPYELRAKVIRFCLDKGYDYEMIIRVWKEEMEMD